MRVIRSPIFKNNVRYWIKITEILCFKDMEGKQKIFEINRKNWKKLYRFIAYYAYFMTEI